MSSPIAELLLASAPFEPDVELFGRFVGAWDMHGRVLAPDGGEQRFAGRWDFGYVLGGRAIQDVLFCKGAEHGTTIRTPRGDGSWDVVWITPVNRAVRRLTARAEGERIVLTGVDGDRHLRWSFNDIGPDSFVWRGEESFDGGASFRLAEEMRLQRA